MYTEPELSRKFTNRLHYLIGHFKAIDDMVLRKRSYAEITQQLLAVNSALKKLILFYDDALRKEIMVISQTLLNRDFLEARITSKLHQVQDRCSHYSSSDLPKIIFELQQIENFCH